MKRTVLIICLVVATLICVIVGTYIHLGPAVKGSRNLGRKIANSVTRSIRDGVYDRDDEDLFDSDDFFTDFEIDNDIPAFTKLSAKGGIMAISVERGNSYHISAKYNHKKLCPEYSVEDGVLKITQPMAHSKMNGNNKCKLEITVPYGVKLDSLDIKVDVGAIELEGFDIKSGDIDTDVGAIALSQVEFDELDISSDVGAVAIELISPAEEYTISASSSVGAISVDGKNAKRKYSSKGSTGKTLRIHTDVGGVEIK